MPAIAARQARRCSKRSPASASWSSATSCSTTTSGATPRASRPRRRCPWCSIAPGHRHGRRRGQRRRTMSPRWAPRSRWSARSAGDDNGGEARWRTCRHGASRFDAVSCRTAPTITKTRVIVRNQQLCRLDAEDPPARLPRRPGVGPGASRLLRAQDRRNADAVILSDYAKGLLTTELIARIAQLARDAGKFVALDPKPAGGKRFAGLDLLTPNRREAARTGRRRIRDAAAADFRRRICAADLERYHPRNLVITLGADGMLLSRAGRVLAEDPDRGAGGVRCLGRRRHGDRRPDARARRRRRPRDRGAFRQRRGRRGRGQARHGHGHAARNLSPTCRYP